MAVRTSRLERITNLVLALLDTPRPLSLREIGGAVAGYPTEPGALRQAFERDKRTLRDGGIPVAVERLDGDDQVGYRILPEHYYLPDLHLEPAEEEGRTFDLEDELTVGRSPGCGVSTSYDVFSSTLHARLFRLDGDLWAEDLGSTNGTWVNTIRINERTRLEKGDLLQVGGTVFEVGK